MTIDVSGLDAIRKRVAEQSLTSQAAEDRALLLELFDDLTAHRFVATPIPKADLEAAMRTAVHGGRISYG